MLTYSPGPQRSVGTGVGVPEGAGVGIRVGRPVGSGAGTSVGDGKGTKVGSFELSLKALRVGARLAVGNGIGRPVGSGIGMGVGFSMGLVLGNIEGNKVGRNVGPNVGSGVGSKQKLHDAEHLRLCSHDGQNHISHSAREKLLQYENLSSHGVGEGVIGVRVVGSIATSSRATKDPTATLRLL